MPYWLSIMSSNRPDNVVPMTDKVGAATWYVPEDQFSLYRQAGASALRDGPYPVAKARNEALADAFECNAICVQLDDDLKRTWFVGDGRKSDVAPNLALDALVEQLEESEFYLAGVSPTDNAYFARGGTKLFVIGSAMAVKPCPLVHDVRLLVKEDYDYTCQHILAYGGALRVDNLLFSFTHFTNQGGIEWSKEVNSLAQTILYKKWPGWIHPHPRKEQEVSLRLPRRQRTVLT